MKRIFVILMLVFGLCGCVAPQLCAQQDVMKQAAEGYKNLTTVKADVKKTVHNSMVAKDVVSTGTFYFKKPAKMCISTNGGKDKLLTDGEHFTIVQNGKPSTAASKGTSPLTPLIKAMKSIAKGDTETDLSDVADVDMEREGDLVILTIAPITRTAAERKNLMFQSFVITVDSKKGDLKSIRLNEKGKNYQLYEFSNMKRDVKIDESVFSE